MEEYEQLVARELEKNFKNNFKKAFK